MSRALWIVQALLAATFLFSGVIKLASPDDLLAQMVPFFPATFVRFIATCEALGAFGLVLPALLRIRPSLTPLAAAGLLIIMAGATILTPTLGGLDISLAILPLVLGVLAGFIAYGRTRLAPIQPKPRHTPHFAQSS